MNPDANSLFIAQYQALRDEIVKRLEQRQQVVTFTLIIAGSFFGLGVQPGTSALTVLCYPILALFLACICAQHTTRIGQISSFLLNAETRLFTGVAELWSWESYRRDLWAHKRRTLSDYVNIPAHGLFVGTQLLSVVIGIVRFVADRQGLFFLLIVLDGVAMVLTVLILHEPREGVNADESKEETQA